MRRVRTAPANPTPALRLLILSAWLLAFAACTRAPRSVLLITVDTLRADHLSAYGYPLPTAAAVDRLAARGVLFRFAFAASTATAPSHASMFTGRYPSFHSVGNFNGQLRLHRSATTLAEVLSAHGYTTAAIVSNPVLRASRVGLDQGFDSYDDAMDGQELNRNTKHQIADQAVTKAIAKLDAVGDRPTFLWLHLQEPHGPYNPPAGWRCPQQLLGPEDDRMLPIGTDHSGHQAIPKYQRYGEERWVDQYRRRYDCEIAFFDRQLDHLLNRLEQDRRWRDALVILTSDHGEALGEDGFYFAHGHSVGLDLVRVPLILAGAGLPGGREVKSPVSNVSLYATVLDLLGLEASHGVEPSLVPSIRKQSPSRPIFVESLNQVGIISGNTFLRKDRYPPEATEFWDDANPNTGGFWKPLGREVVRPFDAGLGEPWETVAEVEARLEDFERRAAAFAPHLAALSEETPLSPEDEAALRSLGYLN